MLGLFNNQSVIDSTMKIIEHLSGADDMTGKEKAQFMLDYQKATKHQSASRRVIALIVALTWATLIATWLLSSGLNVFMEDSGLRMFANNIKIFMGDIVLEPFNIVIMFYFAIHGARVLSKD